jgi:hypothetical protein
VLVRPLANRPRCRLRKQPHHLIAAVVDQVGGPAADVWIVAADARGLALRHAPVAVGRRLLLTLAGTFLLVPTLQPSMLIAPVPCSNTLAATVPLNGLRATVMGSNAGFNAVPQPSHCWASGVAGAVICRMACRQPSGLDPRRPSNALPPVYLRLRSTIRRDASSLDAQPPPPYQSPCSRPATSGNHEP